MSEQQQTKQVEQTQVMTFGQGVLQELIPISMERKDIADVSMFFSVILDKLHLCMGSIADTSDKAVRTIILSDAINQVRRTAVVTCNAMLYGDHIELDTSDEKESENEPNA